MMAQQMGMVLNTSKYHGKDHYNSKVIISG